MSIKIALADDHVLLRNGLANLIREYGYEVVCEADDGRQLTERIAAGLEPDIVLMDINMPHMDGYAATAWLRAERPDCKVLALSMYDDETAIVRMLKSGARGYILKDSDPADLRQALLALQKGGYYQTELVTGKLLHALQREEETAVNLARLPLLTDKEREFLRLACTEMTYKEIADQMHLSPRTIDGYRDDLFEKLGLKSRVGLVLFAIRNGIVKP
ncbi:MAG: response regulator transcription factor [Chitinophagaceae bacterium]|nr:MAG: response regulator transcription factor [Chitinophagaceae bacterium]